MKKDGKVPTSSKYIIALVNVYWNEVCKILGLPQPGLSSNDFEFQKTATKELNHISMKRGLSADDPAFAELLFEVFSRHRIKVLRQSPDYLVIGEVRDGMALITGHIGAYTFHADSPREAARLLATMMEIKSHIANQMKSDEVDEEYKFRCDVEIGRLLRFPDGYRSQELGSVL